MPSTKIRRSDAARESLRTSRRFNPFDRKTAELLGRVEYEREHYREALEAVVDAFLLLTEHDRDDAGQLRARIRQLKKLPLKKPRQQNRHRKHRTSPCPISSPVY